MAPGPKIGDETYTSPAWLTAVPAGRINLPAASSVLLPDGDCRNSAPSAGAPPPSSQPSQLIFASSTTASVPFGPPARSTIDVYPSANRLQLPVFGASGSQTASTEPGLIRQICDVPGVAGKPRSSPTYQ